MIWKILGAVDLLSALLLGLTYGSNSLIWILLMILIIKGTFSLLG